MQNKNIEAQVLVNGKSVAEYRHDTGRLFVEGKESTEWSLRIKNDNSHRVMVVVGVDGVNVIDSKPVGTSKTEAGYVINAHDSVTIKGYRLDNDAVASFKFTKADQAYASKDKNLTGTTGVIGIRVYSEKEKPIPAPTPQPIIIREDHHHYHDYWKKWPYWRDYEYQPMWHGTTTCGLGANDMKASYTSNVLRSASLKGSSEVAFSCCSAEVSPQSLNCAQTLDSNPFSLGSSWGSKAESKVKEVEFEVGKFLAELVLYYTTREGLKTLGIDLTRAAQVVFPEHSPGRYCEKPSGWVG